MGYQLLERKKFDYCYGGIILGVFFFLINHGGLISYEEGIVQSSKCEVKNQNLCLLQVGSRTTFLIALYAMLGGSLTLFCVARLPGAHLLFWGGTCSSVFAF